MEDFAGKITEILNNPELMQQIKSFAGIPSSETTQQNTEPSKKNYSQKTKQKSHTEHHKEESSMNFPPEMLQTFLKLAPILSSLKKEDKYTRFIKALKPLLSESKQQKLDKSSQILQIIKILPLLKDKGIF